MFFDPNDTRPVAVILCGPPGSGKTTFRRRKLPKWGLVSTDNIIMDIAAAKGITYSEAFASSYDHAASQFLDALATYTMFNRSIILDRTHLSPGARAATLAKLKGYRTIAVYFSPLTDAELIARVKQRELDNGQGVPVNIVKEMNAAYQIPSLEEGFDLVVNANEIA